MYLTLAIGVVVFRWMITQPLTQSPQVPEKCESAGSHFSKGGQVLNVRRPPGGQRFWDDEPHGSAVSSSVGAAGPKTLA